MKHISTTVSVENISQFLSVRICLSYILCFYVIFNIINSLLCNFLCNKGRKAIFFLLYSSELIHTCVLSAAWQLLPKMTVFSHFKISIYFTRMKHNSLNIVCVNVRKYILHEENVLISHSALHPFNSEQLQINCSQNKCKHLCLLSSSWTYSLVQMWVFATSPAKKNTTLFPPWHYNLHFLLHQQHFL